MLLLLLQSLRKEFKLGALLALLFFRNTSRDLGSRRNRSRRKRASLCGDGKRIDVASAERMVAMARLVEAVEVSAQIVDAAAGRDDGGALVLGAGPVAAGIEGKDLREGGLSAADGPAHVGADFGHFVAEKGDVWGPG